MLFLLMRDTVYEWLGDNVPRLGAALAFYTFFSLTPLLLIVIGIAGVFLGRQSAQDRIIMEIQGMVGAASAEAIRQMLEAIGQPTVGIRATLIGLATLFFGATGVLVELQDSLNAIFNVEPKRRGLWGLLRYRLVSFAMILGLGFLLLVSLSMSALLSWFGEMFSSETPSVQFLIGGANLVVSMGVITLLFAAIYKFLPDTVLEWRDVWLGAFVTAILFSVGKQVIGYYLGRLAVMSIYGAAGALAVILLWTYYSAQVVFLGAEFIQVYSRHRGGRNLTPRRPPTGTEVVRKALRGRRRGSAAG